MDGHPSSPPLIGAGGWTESRLQAGSPSTPGAFCCWQGRLRTQSVHNPRSRPHPWQASQPRTALTFSSCPLTSSRLRARPRSREADSLFQSAVRTHESLNAPYLIALTQLDYADLLVARADPVDARRAEEMAGEALVASKEHGFGALEQRAEALLHLSPEMQGFLDPWIERCNEVHRRRERERALAKGVPVMREPKK